MNKAEAIKHELSCIWNIHDEHKGKPLDELKEIVASDRLPFAVLCLNLSGSLNIGTIVRTSHILGAREIIIFGSRRFDMRSLVGADKYFPIYKIAGLDKNGEIDVELLDLEIKRRKYNPIFIETGGIPYLDFRFNEFITNSQLNGLTPCLIVGNEGFGIPDKILEIYNRNCVEVPQRGVIRSMNVSNAFAIICAYLSELLT